MVDLLIWYYYDKIRWKLLYTAPNLILFRSPSLLWNSLQNWSIIPWLIQETMYGYIAL
jgi:hypothetical protein